MTRAVAAMAFLIFSTLVGTAAFAEVDMRTPWANVYVGPGGVYVHGPWLKAGAFVRRFLQLNKRG